MIPKILLVRPSFSTVLETTPPLGILYLASALRNELGAQVRVIDLQTVRLNREVLLGQAAAFQPDIVGISALSGQAAAVHKLAEYIDGALPKAVKIVGGPYGTTQPDKALDDGLIDHCVIGEGERTFPALVRELMNGGDPASVPGVAFRRDGAVIRTTPREPEPDLDSIPFPAFDLIDVGVYGRRPRMGTIYKHQRYFSIFTSRGCPYRCSYCHRIFGKRFRARSPENVLEEIDILYHRHGIREIQILDDIFNFKKDRAVAILKGIVDRGYGLALAFPNGVRGDLIDEEIADWLKRAGTYKITVAIETASPRLQKALGKDLDLAKAKRGIEILARRGMVVHGFFMLGFPDETREELAGTAAFARKSALHSASFFFVQPLPGSDLHARISAAAGGLADLPFADYFDPGATVFPLTAATSGQVKRIGRNAYIRFYLRSGRLWRILRDMPNRRQLFFLASLAIVQAFLPGYRRKIFSVPRNPDDLPAAV